MSDVEVRGLRVELTDGRPIVRDASFALAAGETMGLVGESGSGKSTLALALLGYARRGSRIAGGEVRVGGTDLLSLRGRALRRARGGLVAYVPQDPATALNPLLPIGVQLTEEMDVAPARARARAGELLERVGLPSDAAMLRRRPRELSGGQQQRVAISMALMRRPRLVVLDEPTTGLDVATQSRVLELVRELCAEENDAAVYVSHDLAVIANVAQRVSVMYAGDFVEQGATAQVLRSPAHPYSLALLDAVPSVRERLKLRPIDGRAPAVGETGEGCPYAPRCPFARLACRERDPELREVSPERLVRCIRAEEVLDRRSEATRERAEIRTSFEESPLLSVRGLSASYGGNAVLHDVSFDVRRGECVALVGESGSGKTTLSRCLIGLHAEWDGGIRLRDVQLARSARDRSPEARRSLQYIFQNPYASLNPRRTIGASLRVPLEQFSRLDGRETRRRVGEALERVELPAELADRYASELSGGQRQRVAIARSLLCDPELLVCDEVTSALDVSVQASIVELLRSLLDDGLSMVFVTHDLAVVRSIADSVIVLDQGRIVEAAPTEQLLDAPREEYTRTLAAHTLDLVR